MPFHVRKMERKQTSFKELTSCFPSPIYLTTWSTFIHLDNVWISKAKFQDSDIRFAKHQQLLLRPNHTSGVTKKVGLNQTIPQCPPRITSRVLFEHQIPWILKTFTENHGELANNPTTSSYIHSSNHF